MIAFPVWSASVPCCHVQKMSAHHCCHQQMAKPSCHHAGQMDKADTCHCDQFQHSQFVLSLPSMSVVQPVTRFETEHTVPAPLAERHETIIRPPIT
jgi:hypothetical protein